MGRNKKPIEEHWRTVAVRVSPSTEDDIIQLMHTLKLRKSAVARRLIEIGLTVERQVSARAKVA